MSPLGLGALTGNVSCLEILLNAGADVDWQDEQKGITMIYLIITLQVGIM